MVLGKAKMFGRVTFSWIHAQKILIFSLKHSMLDTLVEPKRSAPNLYASDSAPCQIVSEGIDMVALS